MSGEVSILKLPELYRNSKKEHDPAKATAYHECGHGLIQVSHGLLPKLTSLIAWEGANGFSTGGFYACYGLGVNWGEEAAGFDQMFRFGGIVAGALYSGIYNWCGGWVDLKLADRDAKHDGINVSDVIGYWERTHQILIENYDLLEMAAERLYQDKIIDDLFWENEILLSR
jgi:hypothetical protein